MIQTSGPESSSLKQQLEYRKRLMDKINEIHCADNLNTILLDIKDSIAALFNAQRITIYLADAKRNLLISKVLSGSEVKQIVVPISDASLSGFCALSATVLNIKNAYDDHELCMVSSNLKFDKSWDRKTGFTTRQVLCVPMKFQRTLIGVIQIINHKDDIPFTDTDISYAQELATSLSIAIHNIYRLQVTTKIIRQRSRYNYLLDKNLMDEKTLERHQAIRMWPELGWTPCLCGNSRCPARRWPRRSHCFSAPSSSDMNLRHSRWMKNCSGVSSRSG